MDRIEEIDAETDLLLKHPFTMLVAGSTGSGKTHFVRQVIGNFDRTTTLNRPIRVLWSYGIYQDLYNQPINEQIATLTYREGFPEDAEGYDVIVLDDLQSTAGDDKRLADLFTRFSHHRNVSVIFIVQNLFLQSKTMRNVTLNSHYLVLLTSRRDRSQITRLGSQLYPGETSFFANAYKMALNRRFGYLFIDLTPTTAEENRIKTNVLPEEYPIIIFRKSHAL